MDDLTFRQLGPVDEGLLADAADLLCEGLGAGYLAVGDLEGHLIGQDHQSLFAAFDGERMVGAATTGPLEDQIRYDIEWKVDADGLTPVPFPHYEVGLIQSSTVATDWRRRGVGSKLTALRLKYLADSGCTAALSISWVSGLPDNSVGVLGRSGFVRLYDLVDFWYEDGDGGPDWFCPVCLTRCRCTAAIFFRVL